MAQDPGIARSPRATERLFFAFYPDAPALERIEQLAHRLHDAHGLSRKPFAAERFHVTLLFIGNFVGVPDAVVTRASAAALGIEMAPFPVAFDRAVSFRRAGNRPFVLLAGRGLGEMTDLHRALGAAMDPSGQVPRAESGYVPHLTLQYDDREVAEQAIDPIAWTAREFVLVRSLLGRSKHVALARWPLRG